MHGSRRDAMDTHRFNGRSLGTRGDAPRGARSVSGDDGPLGGEQLRLGFQLASARVTLALQLGLSSAQPLYLVEHSLPMLVARCLRAGDALPSARHASAHAAAAP